MLPKISASSANQYQLCQKKYWHKKINKTPKDAGYKDPTAFRIGRACAEFHERFSSIESVTKENVLNTCIRCGLDANQAAIVFRMLHTYISTFDKGENVTKEVWIDHPDYEGRVDKIAEFNGKAWITEDKTASEINPGLETILKTDTQLCLYAEFLVQLGCEGIIYRVVTKSKKRRKKNESWESFVERLDCETTEIKFKFEDLYVQDCLDKLDTIRAEIAYKTMPSEFLCNMKACETYGSKCEFYSKCHPETSKTSEPEAPEQPGFDEGSSLSE